MINKIKRILFKPIDTKVYPPIKITKVGDAGDILVASLNSGHEGRTYSDIQEEINNEIVRFSSENDVTRVSFILSFPSLLIFKYNKRNNDVPVA